MLPDLTLILVGLGIGIVVTVPVGPVNILCIQRTIERGFLAGVATGLGAVLGDGLIGLAAASGISAIADAIATNNTLIKLAGGGLLLIFGFQLLRAVPSPAPRNGVGSGWIVPQSFFLTITNPGAVLGMLAIFGSISSALVVIDSFAAAVTIVLAVMAGSLLWWISLARVVHGIRHRLSDRSLRRINQAAGLLLVAFGLALIGQGSVSALARGAALAVGRGLGLV